MTAADHTDPRLGRALDHALELGEIGIAVAAYHRGELIVDAVAGVTDVTTGTPVDERTLFPVFSVTKGVTAAALHLQAERGLVDLQAPIARYWPEFAAAGKHTVTVEQALSHRAGIPQMPAGVTPQLLADWQWMTDRIAHLTPRYEPGTTNAYHVLVWGWIIGEVVRRTDPAHRPFDVFVTEEICAPLGVTDFHLGVPDDDLGRVATLYGGDAFTIADQHDISPRAVFPGSQVHNQPVMRQAVDPGAGAITTAASVARIFAMLAEGGRLDGVRLLSPDRIATFTRPRTDAHAPDQVLTIPVWFGANGFWLGGEPGASDPLVGDHRSIIYSPGAGGSVAWADLRDRIAVAICHNNMDAPVSAGPGSTFEPVVRAVREIIAERERSTR
ncbi:CubicO group peptidase (beta-lactamase class C family) [Streptosporangium becharense]|uniref:CubicO group peptidase (Beta-lactamase class C family) n=1 Tax=Streptosporangium becharense TaxID=1816182 RepID=A0A7W9IMR3_9ACTN|nr:serine hydrolase domain-containing protein [Streptosporangium becharense]MBB2914375.1 CubicO group peptidase (beta-lactamase class C family) [Streptosporangium becharense]MBB5823593.1 CubicO group peptidase (beta-lactamase class C family) [Streptosporangium becharense]